MPTMSGGPIDLLQRPQGDPKRLHFRYAIGFRLALARDRLNTIFALIIVHQASEESALRTIEVDRLAEIASRITSPVWLFLEQKDSVKEHS